MHFGQSPGPRLPTLLMSCFASFVWGHLLRGRMPIVVASFVTSMDIGLSCPSVCCLSQSTLFFYWSMSAASSLIIGSIWWWGWWRAAYYCVGPLLIDPWRPTRNKSDCPYPGQELNNFIAKYLLTTICLDWQSPEYFTRYGRAITARELYCAKHCRDALR